MPLRKPKTNQTGEGIFDTLLHAIVSGKYPPGTRLPAERELALTMGTSRATLREALRRLEQWNLIAPRRGSGILVRDVARDGTVDILPAYVKSGIGGPETAQLIGDLLRLRRTLITELVRLVGARYTPGSLAGARVLVERAWQAREDQPRFVEADFAVIQGVIAAGRFLPGVWLLNSLRGVYVELASTFGNLAGEPPPDTYRAAFFAAFDALERGDAETAARALDRYLAEHDRAMHAALGTGVDP